MQNIVVFFLFKGFCHLVGAVVGAAQKIHLSVSPPSSPRLTKINTGSEKSWFCVQKQVPELVRLVSSLTCSICYDPFNNPASIIILSLSTWFRCKNGVN
jgi:hypothetical protein